MTTEVDQKEFEQEEVATDDAAFAAGFAEARGEEPPTEDEPQQQEQIEEPAQVEEQPEVVEQEQQQQPVIAGLTEDQVKSLLVKAGQVDDVQQQLRKAFGRMGELNQTIQSLQQRSGSGVKLSREKMTRLSEQYPELADLIAGDLSDALQVDGAGQNPAFDPQIIDQRVSSVEQKLQQTFEKRLLTRDHPDWQDIVKTDDFALWTTNVLSKEEAARLGDSWDADFISSKLSDFKKFREQSEQKQQTKQKRLEAAITPRGGVPSQIKQTEEEAFMAAFKNVRNPHY